MIDFMRVMGNRAGILLERTAKAVAFSLGRVGALFYLLFLQLFQSHVPQVCFL